MLTIIQHEEVGAVLLQPLVKFGLPNLVLSLLESEFNQLKENKLERYVELPFMFANCFVFKSFKEIVHDWLLSVATSEATIFFYYKCEIAYFAVTISGRLFSI